jgi:hypothetical protein
MNEKFAGDEQGSSGRSSAQSLGPRPGRSSMARKGLTECCFSISNLALIVATVIALTVLIRSLQDEPLADYYEYLLSLSFHRQLIYVIIVLPFVLLVPIYNALSVLFNINHHNSSPPSAGSKKQTTVRHQSTTRALTKVKLFYLAILILLVFLALVFVGSYVNSSTLSSQIELELTKFMRSRYESEFAYQLLDRVQEQYECCDEMWYRANLRDQLPLSCFVANTGFSVYYKRTCSEVLASIIGTRCYVVAACLIVILIALACLFSIDLGELFASPDGHYEITNNDAPSSAFKPTENGSTKMAANDHFQGQKLLTSSEQQAEDTSNFGHNPSLAAIAKRITLEERERASAEQPLLQSSRLVPPSRRTFGAAGPSAQSKVTTDDDDDEQLKEPPIIGSDPVLLARARYQLIQRERSQSPRFVSSPEESASGGGNGAQLAGSRDSLADNKGQPIKSVLKKSVSNSSTIDDQEPVELREQSARRSVDELSDDPEFEADYTERLRQTDSLLRQKQIQRESQTRRSLLSVRFADEED